MSRLPMFSPATCLPLCTSCRQQARQALQSETLPCTHSRMHPPDAPLQCHCSLPQVQQLRCCRPCQCCTAQRNVTQTFNNFSLAGRTSSRASLRTQPLYKHVCQLAPICHPPDCLRRSRSPHTVMQTHGSSARYHMHRITSPMVLSSRHYRHTVAYSWCCAAGHVCWHGQQGRRRGAAAGCSLSAVQELWSRHKRAAATQEWSACGQHVQMYVQARAKWRRGGAAA